MWSYMLEAASTVRIVCDDTNVSVLVVYWTWRKNIRENIQTDNWDGYVLDIHATVDTLRTCMASCSASTPCQSGCDRVLPLRQGQEVRFEGTH